MSAAVATEVRPERLGTADRRYRIGVIRATGPGPRWSRRASRCSTRSATTSRSSSSSSISAPTGTCARGDPPGRGPRDDAGSTRSSSAPWAIRGSGRACSNGTSPRIRFELDPVREPPPGDPVSRRADARPVARGGRREHGGRRENSEGLYRGGRLPAEGDALEVAVQSSVNTRHGVERIARFAFEYAMRRTGAGRSRSSTRRTS